MGEPKRERTKQSSKFYVHPDELARKLVKEMEAHKISHSGQDSVCSRYTLFLCPDDFARLQPRQDEIADRLQRHLGKYARSKKYAAAADFEVALVMDPDLSVGRFGILAERIDPLHSVQGSVRGPVYVEQPDAVPDLEPRPAAQSAAPNSISPSHRTKVIPPAQAAELDLARRTIVLKAGDRVREFNKSRVIVGRARDVDFRVDDPNVSRRHAAIYWDDGRIVVQDLESTNGTMVNGYPVSSTALRPGDVMAVGDCRITVETR
ncbi:MAG: DUF3662 domain-containing protein [Actinobacteria bacterium]|nr:DUF3662 domain-containing protein [Actinomycetota bacterium]